MREAMTLRPLNLPSSNGLFLEDRQSYRHSPEISSPTVGSIMKLLVCCSVPPALTGPMQSKSFHHPITYPS